MSQAPDLIGGPTTVVQRLESENRELRAQLEGWRAKSVVWLRQTNEVAAEVERLTAERDRLAKVLDDAIECVESWAAYADAYFQQKHNLAGDLARLRAALAALPKEEA